MSKRNDSLFRIRFEQDESIYEIYARSLGQETIYGFLEVSEIVFGESTSLVVDPTEEKLKAEFADVERSYIPLHTIIRIDEVMSQGVAKIYDHVKDNNVVRAFPTALARSKKPE